jgi:apolipoprotein N-acyltransferase
MQASHRLLGFGLATLSGCLWFLAVTPFDLSLLAWIASVPMLLAIDRAPTYAQALLLGWWAGVVETAGGFHWLIDTTQRFANFPWIGAALVFFLFCATRAIVFLLFTALVYPLRRRLGVPMMVLAPVVLVWSEYVVPQLFPCGQWISQAWHPLVIQISELTGPFGVTALLMVVNGALYDLAVRAPAARLLVACAAVLLIGALAFGWVRMRQVDAEIARAPRLEIGLVQPNFAYSSDGEISTEEILRQLAALQQQSQRLEHAGAELIVWSEGSYPVSLPRDFSHDYPATSSAMIRRGFTTPVLVGTTMIAADDVTAFNTALLLNREGQMIGRYDKVELLAFGEYIPGVTLFPWIRHFLPEGSGAFQAGTGPAILTLPGVRGQDWRLGPLICYEDLLPDFIRRVGALQPDVLVNLTSDQWFGDGGEPWQHLALSVFSAVEVRTSLVRAVNSGISANIDPNGRLVQRTYADDPYRHPHPADALRVSVPKMAGGHTLFIAWGDWFVYLCMAATAIFGVFAYRAGRVPGARPVPGVRAA